MPAAASFRPSHGLWRSAAIGACLGYAVLAIGSVADRSTADHPGLAARIPGLFASEALRSRGRQLLEAGDNRRALPLGAAAVAQEPVDPASTALLGAARFAGGDQAGADRAFMVAGQLGWRIPMTQIYWMGRALEGGDFRVAALRLDALLRQKPALLKDRRLLDPMESDPRGREALAQRLLAMPNWLTAYASANQESADNVVLWRAQTLIRMSRLGGSVGCEKISPIVSRLILMSEARVAHEVWWAHCPDTRRAIVFDGKFERAAVDQSRSEFDWFFVGQSDVEALTQKRDGPLRSGLQIRGNGNRDRFVVRQAIFAPSGKYQLSWKAENPDGTPTNRILASLGCDVESADIVNATFDIVGKRWTTIVDLDNSCEVRWLKFGVAQGPTIGFLTDVGLFPMK